MTAPPFNEAEGTALRDALNEHFGGCSCHSWHIIRGARVWVETCAGHSFLAEPNRLSLLLGIKRDKQRLIDEEFGQEARPAPVLPW